MTQFKADQPTIETPGFKKIDRGASAPIAYFWKNKNTPMVRLIHPQTDQIMDFEVLSCADKGSESYMLVGWKDDQQHACVTKIVGADASSLQILSGEEQLAEIDWCQVDQCEHYLVKLGVNVPDLSDARGDLSEEQLLYHQLTNQFYIRGEILAAGRQLHIVTVTEAHHYAFVKLRLDDLVSIDSYSGLHILEIGGASYCLLSLPPDISSDEPVAPIFVLEVCGDSLATISTKQFELVKRRIIALIKGCERQDFDSVKKVLSLACR